VRSSGGATSATYAEAAGSKRLEKIPQTTIIAPTSHTSEAKPKTTAAAPLPARPAIITGRRPRRSEPTPPSGVPANAPIEKSASRTPASAGDVPISSVR